MKIFPSSAQKNITYSPEMERFSDFVRGSLELNQQWWTQADLDTRFEAGDQFLWQQYYGQWGVSGSKQFTFNLIRSLISMPEGYQRAHRKSTIAVPREGSDQETADQFSELLLWVNENQGVYETISNAFRGALITGMNLLQVWMDYRNDPISGDIKVSNCPYNSIIIDPFFTKMDLSDCNGIVKRSYVTPVQAASFLPQYKDEILSMKGFGPMEETFQFMPQNQQWTYENLLTYDEYWYPATRIQRLLVDTITGETIEWRADNDEGLRAFLGAFPQIKLVKQEISTTMLTIIVQGVVMYSGPNPMGIDRYPFVPVMAYYNPELGDFNLRCAGIVRNLRDAQFLYNHRKVLELQNLESTLNGGWIVEEDTMINPEDLYDNRTGKVLWTKKGKLGGLSKVPNSTVDPSWFQASGDMKDLMNQIANISETLMGRNTDAVSGFHESLRTAQGIIANQRLFDQLDNSQKVLGSLMIDLIQNNFTPGKVKRILNKQPTEQFYDKTFGKYDAAIEEGYNTSTQRQMQFAQLIELRKLGVPIPDENLIKAATIQNKNDVLQVMEQQKQQVMQQQQMQNQMAMAQMQAETKLTEARYTAETGLGIERLSRVQENKALATERMAEAQKDRELGLLHLTKAIKEIQSIDLAQLEKIIALAQMVREQESVANQPSSLEEVVGLTNQNI